MDRTVRNPTHNHQSYELTEKTIDSDFSYVNGMPQRADRLGEDDSRQCQPPYLYPEALAETIPFLNVINAFDICSAFFALVAINFLTSRHSSPNGSHTIHQPPNYACLVHAMDHVARYHPTLVLRHRCYLLCRPLGCPQSS